MPSPIQENNQVVDGLPNFFYEAKTPGFGFQFQQGIHNVRLLKVADGSKRIPLVIVSSTPRKAGSEDTPWRDRYDHDHGYVIYYGDNKVRTDGSIHPPETAEGNRLMLDLLKYYQCDDEKDRLEHCVPVIFFERIAIDGRPKGNAIFHGFGILESVELVTQYDKNHRYFANYRLNFCILSLSENNEEFDWRWISDRCDRSLSVKDTMRYAPSSWKRFIKEGMESVHLIRRSVAGNTIVKKEDQLPGNPALLKQIYEYYTNIAGKHNFEYLAMEVAIKTAEETGAKCVPGWITQKSADGGIDFVFRIDVGSDQLASVNIVVLGQAKCEKLDKPTNSIHIARTVARLKRGWIGVYVTTSFFSEPSQTEAKEDAYPIMLINGAQISKIVEKELFEEQVDLETYLKSLHGKYNRATKLPEDVSEI